MNRSEIRGIVRRQLQDPGTGVQWTNTELDTLIEQAYMFIQTRVFAHDPNAHISWDTLDTVADQSEYALPATFGIRRVGLKSTAADTVYEKLRRATYDDILESTSTEARYAVMGQFIAIFPAPSSAVVDGIQLLHTPIMSMDSDDDVPVVKEPLHMAIVWMTVLLASDEDESRDVSQITGKLNSVLDSIPQWYQLHTDENPRFVPERI